MFAGPNRAWADTGLKRPSSNKLLPSDDDRRRHAKLVAKRQADLSAASLREAFGGRPNPNPHRR